MAWVTWVTWVFVAVVVVVGLVAWALSSGRLGGGMDAPYAPPPNPPEPGPEVSTEGDRDGRGEEGEVSDIEWSMPAPGGWRREDAAPPMRSTTTRPPGEHADGRHEAQDR